MFASLPKLAHYDLAYKAIRQYDAAAAHELVLRYLGDARQRPHSFHAFMGWIPGALQRACVDASFDVVADAYADMARLRGLPEARPR